MIREDIFEKDHKENFMDFLRNYSGDVQTLNFAIGFYFIGKLYGWRFLYLVHGKRTVRKYEALLNIKVRKEFEPISCDGYRSSGLVYMFERHKNFWKAVSGELKVKGRRQINPSYIVPLNLVETGIFGDRHD